MLGFRPHNMRYYLLALSHKSTSQQKDASNTVTGNNERLEFLGDSVLGTVVADILYRLYPDIDEGELTNMRSRLVQRATLDKLAITIGLDKLVNVNRKSTINFSNAHINGNAFEALIGAIYLDRGYAKCQEFIEETIFGKYIDIKETATQETNFKSHLLELAQKQKLNYKYEIISSDFDKKRNTTTFVAQVSIEDIIVGTGKGTNKKEAQQDASKHALEYMKSEEFLEKVAELHRRKAEEEEAARAAAETEQEAIQEQEPQTEATDEGEGDIQS